MVNQQAISMKALKLYQLRWPEKIEEIGITGEEKKSLEKTINALRLRLGVMPQSLMERRNAECPRKVIVTNCHSFVILSSKEGLAPFRVNPHHKKKIKWVWDCASGSMWLQKPVHSAKEKNVIAMWNYFRCKEPKVAQGLLDLYENQADEVYGDSPVFYEKKGAILLQDWLKDHPLVFHPKSLEGVLNALKQLHSMDYVPPQALTPKNCLLSHSLIQGKVQGLFYGHLNIEKFFIEFDDNQQPRIVLNCSSQLAYLHQVSWKSGWGSPEIVQLAGIEAPFVDVIAFNLKYGRKMDSWVVGLIAGSLLKGGFTMIEGFYLPSFAFITQKIKTVGNEVLDGEIAELTQKEVDAELKPLIKQEKDPEKRKLWIKVKKWLTVDPDKRPTLAD